MTITLHYPLQSVARPDSWIQDLISLSLNDETKPIRFSSESQYQDKTETFFLVSMLRGD